MKPRRNGVNALRGDAVYELSEPTLARQYFILPINLRLTSLPKVAMVTIEPHPTDRNAFRLTTELRLPCGQSQVFDFFADAFNLEQITPPWLNFHVVTPRPIEMHNGALIDYRLRLHGIPIRWKTEICDWDPPFRFTDRQLKGPYRYWHHEHTFLAEGDHTLMRDQVDYAVPGGRLVHKLFVRHDVQQIFEYRRRVMAEMFQRLVSAR